mgnify:CR=1 FL=1|tara:strand:- start:235 stop:411 length:177 start_codon:yes stop_codon:yes gene_type:complete
MTNENDETPVMIGSRTIAYALLGTIHAIKFTKSNYLKEQYKEDRKELQNLLETNWGSQ